MKAKLEFKLPEDQYDFDSAIQGNDMAVVLFKMDQFLRGKIKHNPDNLAPAARIAFEKCREELYSLMNEFNVNIDR